MPPHETSQLRHSEMPGQEVPNNTRPWMRVRNDGAKTKVSA